MTENKSNINRVFPKDVIDYLVEKEDCCESCFSREDILGQKEAFKDTEYIFSTWGCSQFSEDEITEVFPSLKAVFYAAGTVQYFAKPFLNKGVKVFSAWAANAVPVAEYTVAQVILANTGYFLSSRYASNGDYKKGQEVFYKFPGNYGANVGIIGAGMIGRLVIEMLKSYKLNVLVFDPFLSDEKANALGVKKVELDELFAGCQVVSNHLANNEQTKGMLNYSLFAKMPKYATFLNTGRGAQVVEPDLIKILTEREDLVAVLDVTDPEPAVKESEFYSLENCILTPHIAGSSGDEVHRMAEYMLEEFKRFKANSPTKYEVTIEMLKTMA